MKDIKIYQKERKEKKQQYGHKYYKNLSIDEKNKLVEYKKQYYEMIKKRFNWESFTSL